MAAGETAIQNHDVRIAVRDLNGGYGVVTLDLSQSAGARLAKDAGFFWPSNVMYSRVGL